MMSIRTVASVREHGGYLIGRHEERVFLLGQLHAPPSAPPRIILVDGPMGSGKTALVTSALAEVGRPVLLARADRFAGASPLASARPVIENLLDADLQQLIEERSLRGILRECITALRERDVIITIDDAQWLDPMSSQFFADLVSGTAPLTVVLAYRQAMAPARLIDTARSAGASIEHLTVGPLADPDIATLSAGVTTEQQQIIIETADGNPLFARTLRAAFLRHPEATRLDEVLPLGRGPRSELLRSVVSADVRALPAGARRTLEAVAVLGAADPVRLAALTGGDVSEDLALLRRHGLIDDESSEAIHPVVRSSTYQSAAEDDLADLHRRAAALPGTNPLESAEHLSRLRSHLTSDDLSVLLDTAEHALGTDPASVERWLRASLHLHEPSRDLLLARALALGGRVDEAAPLLEPLLDLPGHGAEARALLAHALRMSGQPDEAHEVLSSYAGPRIPALLLELAATSSLTDGHDPADPLLIELSAAHGEPYASASAALRTIALLNTGNIGAARREFDGVLAAMLARPAEELREVMDAAACAVWCAYMLDELPQGIELGERMLRIARRFGRMSVQPLLYCALAFCLTQAGRLEDADAAADLAVETAERYRVPDIVAMARVAQALSAFLQQDMDLLRERRDALQASPLPAVRWWRRTAQSALARTSAMLGEPIPHVLVTDPPDVTTPLRYADAGTVALFDGDNEAARRYYEEGRQLALEYGVASQSALLGVLLSGVIAGDGPASAARAIDLLEEARDSFERLGMPCHLSMALGNLQRLRASATGEALNALTPRETEVADLLADGKTNQQIADALVISRRTAEEHVANVLRKLGLSSRHGVLSALRGR